MEEKLYFKPAKYEKKDRAERNKSNKAKKEKSYRGIKLIIFIVVVVAVILLIVWLLRGKDTVSGRYPENVRDESLSCEKSKEDYEKAKLVDIEDSNVKLNLIFKSQSELKTVSLIYTAIFPTESDAYAVEAVSHAQFNKNLGAAGYSVSKFSNKYARYDNKLIFTLTANANELDEISAPFFMIKTNDDGKIEAKDLKTYRSMYESQGFVCHDSL